MDESTLGREMEEIKLKQIIASAFYFDLAQLSLYAFISASF